jgi:hypothetical protein
VNEDPLDEADEESFPASDPPSYTIPAARERPSGPRKPEAPSRGRGEPAAERPADPGSM